MWRPDAGSAGERRDTAFLPSTPLATRTPSKHPGRATPHPYMSFGASTSGRECHPSPGVSSPILVPELRRGGAEAGCWGVCASDNSALPTALAMVAPRSIGARAGCEMRVGLVLLLSYAVHMWERLRFDARIENPSSFAQKGSRTYGIESKPCKAARYREHTSICSCGGLRTG
jgi:hypothetical protein